MKHETNPFVADIADQSNAQMNADVALINGLAAVHMSYGNLGSAADLISLAQWCAPKDPETQGLAARLAAKRGSQTKAITILREIRRDNDTMPARDVALLARLTRLAH